ncbi:MAG: DNA translocase FtsK [Gemmatimonadaceae bacterium]|nr:DNA translocase FtsK [Gemmatimonadaceae bacterium]
MKREMSGVGLLLLGVFLAGLLMTYAISTDGGLLEVRGAFGAIGAAIVAPLVTILGWSGVVVLPVLPAVHGLRLLGRLDRGEDRSWLWFMGGVLLLAPIGFALGLRVGRETSLVAGVWGGMVAFYLTKFVGYVGAWLAVLAALSGLTIGTLAWNPILALFDRAPKVAAALTPTRGDPSLAALAMAPPPEEMPAIESFAGPSLARDPGAPASRSRTRAPVASGDDDALDEADGSEVWERDDEAAEEPEAVVMPAAPAAKARAAPASREQRVTAAIEATAVPDDDDASTLLPPTSLLTEPPPRNVDANRRELDASGVRLMAALKTFRVEGQLVGRTTGPTVTQFEVEPAAGVKVRQFASLSNDLALAMRANSIRIVAPIPGKGAVGIEVPNPNPEMVAFREIVEHPEYSSARAALPVALGKDLEGRPVIADLAKMPHLLIAGATGSGKSVCVNTIITSLIYRHTPATLRFLMVDPKMVELSVYNTLPHLRHKVITDNRDAAAVLKWAVLEMQDRYALLAANGCRNVQDFNRRVTEGARLQKPRNPEVAFEVNTYDGGILPYIVVIIDEMADLMMTVQGEVETPIAMLAQKARAIGIHLILATQRPSVNVITGLIKANFPSRIAFRVASQIDSRTILDGSGAESLLGNGDMLFLPPGKSEPGRLQGAYLSSEETERLMHWYDAQRARADAEREAAGEVVVAAVAEPDILEQIRAREAADAGGADEDPDTVDRDKLFREAAELCIQHQGGSTSLLQRRLKIGYGRAARIIDQLHFAGILGPPDGSKPRDVLKGFQDLDEICG